ncbi:olfactory receptor 4D5-like [Odontesthes bonariensis]|uniref:olfactory receptor 4D5-like n=1 Tax=Odontesthes bonariensis TaxID=219752 RepID=UPI003F58379E
MDKLNVTDITLSGFVEITKYRYLFFCIMFILYSLIMSGNLTIVYLIWHHKNLHEPMYIFIAALSFNCCLYSTTLYPKLIIDSLTEQQIIPYSACLLQFFMFYFVGGSEFLLLAAMAYDRYVSICQPLRYPTIMSKTTVSILLVMSWFLSACHFAVQVILSAKARLCSLNLKGIFCNNSIYSLQCVTSRALTLFGVVALMDTVIIPMLFTIFTYTRIFILSHRGGKEFRKKATETCLPHLIVLFMISCFTFYDVIIARVESNFPKLARIVMTLQIILYHPVFNPIIYGLKMKEITKHLKSLFSRKKM